MYKNKSFSHIYIEKDIANHPNTKKICSKFKSSTLVEIEHYKDIFNRSFNEFRLQKNSIKIILAKKTSGFLYPISSLIQDQSETNFFYSSFVLNCLYDCDYCFLQGMYPSAYVVVFVNIEDVISSIIDKQKELNDKMFVSISYDSDLLLLEPFTSFIQQIQKKLSFLPITLEVRTKSGNIALLDGIKPSEKILLNFSLSPNIIANKYEKKSASLLNRIKTMQVAIKMGYRVGVAFDPIIDIDDFSNIYNDFFDLVFEKINHKDIDRFIIGTFRMNTAQLKKIKIFLFSDIVYYPYESKNKISTYSVDKNSFIMDFVKNKLSFIDKEKIKYL